MNALVALALTFAHVLGLGLGMVFVVEFIRAFPWPERWRKQKPLSCDVCMTGWSLIAYAHWSWAVEDRHPFAQPDLLTAGTLTLLLLALLKHWRGLSLLPPE